MINKTLEKGGIEEITEVIRKVVGGDYSVHVELSGKNDELDAIAAGINMVIDYVRTSVEDLDRQRKELRALNEQLQQEIAERKRVEEVLSIKTILLEAAAETTLDGILAVDDKDKILLSNRRFQEMWNIPQELIEAGDNAPVLRQASSLIQESKEFVQKVYSLYGQEKGADRTARYLKDGRIFDSYSTPLVDENGNYHGRIWYVRDITQPKQVEAERETLLDDLKKVNLKLEESNRELQDFVYVASHDLREPLRKIASFGTLLQNSLSGNLDEDQQENFQFMIDGSNRMQMMVDDLLTYSRVSTKTKPFGQVDLNNVIDDLKNLELATLLNEAKGAIYVSGTLPPVYGDSPQIHQLLQNLIANGLKFRRDGVTPEITIQAHRVKNNMVCVEVQDNGIGIDKKYHEQVFAMFKRLHSRTRYEGTGIGLAICKKIVRRHGGEIGVKSTLGEGSTFWFTLPRG